MFLVLQATVFKDLVSSIIWPVKSALCRCGMGHHKERESPCSEKQDIPQPDAPSSDLNLQRAASQESNSSLGDGGISTEPGGQA